LEWHPSNGILRGKTSTYGSELVAMRITVEAILELRYILRMMGIKFEPTSNILCDNQAVVINTQFPSSNIKKKHNAVAYHRCRETVAAAIIRTGHIYGKINISDIMTKPASPADYYRLLNPPMYGRLPVTMSPPIRGSSEAGLDYNVVKTDLSPASDDVMDDVMSPGVEDKVSRGIDPDYSQYSPKNWDEFAKQQQSDPGSQARVRQGSGTSPGSSVGLLNSSHGSNQSRTKENHRSPYPGPNYGRSET
jgi:hypothetical protein